MPLIQKDKKKLKILNSFPIFPPKDMQSSDMVLLTLKRGFFKSTAFPFENFLGTSYCTCCMRATQRRRRRHMIAIKISHSNTHSTHTQNTHPQTHPYTHKIRTHTHTLSLPHITASIHNHRLSFSLTHICLHFFMFSLFD